MIDSHCHLTDPRLLEQVEGVLARALAAGVREIVTIATTPEDGVGARFLAGQFAGVFYTVGIHPNESGAYSVGDVERLREFVGDGRCVALGEMGLDYHWKDVPVGHQREMFGAQLELAREVGMPVVIHCREAVGDTLEIMRGFPGVRAVFHCFTGTAEEAGRIVGAGYSLGFTGPVTFKKNEELRRVIAQTPVDRILIETDAPYLTPEPFRSVKTNEPRFVAEVLGTVARVKGITVEEAGRVTAENTRRLYRWPAS